VLTQDDAHFPRTDGRSDEVGKPLRGAFGVLQKSTVIRGVGRHLHKGAVAVAQRSPVEPAWEELLAAIDSFLAQ
jgi:hypothetical protein